jgi:hypothetical protein
MRKMLISEAIRKISTGIIKCSSTRAAITTLFVLQDMGFTHVSLEGE